MSPDRTTRTCSVLPVFSLSAVARQPGIHSIERFNTVVCVASTLIHESPHEAFVMLVIRDVETLPPSHALRRSDVALKIVTEPMVWATCHNGDESA